MNKFNDRREQEMIAEKLWEGLEEATKLCGDQQYCMYLAFSIFGEFLLKDLGEDRFDELVEDIKKKAAES